MAAKSTIGKGTATAGTSNNNGEDFVNQINRLALEVGRKHGYDHADAEVSVFKDFKVQWTRSYQYISFKVSDYMEGASDEAIAGLFDTLFSRIEGKDASYSKAMRDFCLSAEFRQQHRGTYIKRCRSLNVEPQGDAKNLDESIERLKAKGLISGDDDIQLAWTSAVNQRAASCSVLFRVIAVSDQLDYADVPDDVLDYAIYTQYIKIVKGAEVFGYTSEVFTREEERKFEGYKEIERTLDRMNLFL